MAEKSLSQGIVLVLGNNLKRDEVSHLSDHIANLIGAGTRPVIIPVWTAHINTPDETRRPNNQMPISRNIVLASGISQSMAENEGS